MNNTHFPSRTLAIFALLALTIAMATPVNAVTLTWNGADATAGGAGTWNSSNLAWNGATVAWSDGSDAVFPNAAGVVTISGFTPSANTINFTNTAGNYNITGGTLNLTDTAQSIKMTTSTTSTNGQGINSTISGTDITVYNNTSNGLRTLLNLNSANTFTGSLILDGSVTPTGFGNSTQVALGNANSLGGPTNLNTVKFARNFSNLLFTSGGAGGAAGYTASYGNDIDLNSTGSTGVNGFTSGIGAAQATAVITLNGVIKGTGDANLVFTNGLSGGQGKIILANHETYSGSTTMQMASTATASGVVALGIDNALPQGTAFQLGNGSGAPSGTFDMAGFNQTVGSMATGALFIANGNPAFLSGITNTGAGMSTLTIKGGADTTYAAAIGVSVTTAVAGSNDNIHLVLDADNTGTLTLRGTGDTAAPNVVNGYKGTTYSGGTDIHGGTLLAANTTGSATGSGNITVDGTGTLGGSGSVSGNVTVNGGGTLSPGASIESLGTGSVTFNAGGTFKFEIDSTLVTADLLNASGGSLSISTGALLALSDLGTAIVPNGTKFTMISYNGTWDGGTYVGAPDGGVVTISGRPFQIAYSDTGAGGNFASEATGSRFVTLTAVPELGSFITMGLVGCCALGAARFGKRFGFKALGL